jgi:hypothetical protein
VGAVLRIILCKILNPDYRLPAEKGAVKFILITSINYTLLDKSGDPATLFMMQIKKGIRKSLRIQ